MFGNCIDFQTFDWYTITIVIDKRRPPVVLSPVAGPKFVHPGRIAGSNGTRRKTGTGTPLNVTAGKSTTRFFMRRFTLAVLVPL